MPHAIAPPAPAAHPKAIQLHEYWRSKAPAAGLLPGRRHIDPTEIPGLLDNIWLLDVVGAAAGAPRRFCFRLIGDAMHRKGMPGRPGAFIDQLFDNGPQDAAMGDLHAVVDTGLPSWSRGKPTLRHRHEIFELERILLPLAADGKTVDMLLCLTAFYRSDGKEF
jgi:hypothetical protein